MMVNKGYVEYFNCSLKCVFNKKYEHLQCFAVAIDKNTFIYLYKDKPTKKEDEWEGTAVGVGRTKYDEELSEISWDCSLKFYLINKEKIIEITEEEFDLLQVVIDG